MKKESGIITSSKGFSFKRFLLISAILLANPLNTFAACEYTCAEPYDMSSGVSKFFGAVTGVNFISEKIGQSVVKKIFKESLSAKLKVNLDSFSIGDLLGGRFKALEVSGSNLTADGISLSSITMKTLCNFNYIVPDKKNNTVQFKEDLPLAFRVTLSEDNLNKTMKSTGYDKIVDDLNAILGNKSILKVQSAQTKIRDNKFLYVMKVNLPLVKVPQDIIISSDLKVKNGEIRFEEAKIMSKQFSVDLSRLSYILNYLNPLDYTMKIIENKEAKLGISNVAIVDNKIVTDGILVIPKDIISK